MASQSTVVRPSECTATGNKHPECKAPSTRRTIAMVRGMVMYARRQRDVPFLHRLAQQQLVRIVVSICHRVGALRALIPDERHIREELSLPKVIGGVAGAAHR